MQQRCVARVFAPPTPVKGHVSLSIRRACYTCSFATTDLVAPNFLRQRCVYNVPRGLFKSRPPVGRHVFPGDGTVTQKGLAIGPGARVLSSHLQVKLSYLTWFETVTSLNNLPFSMVYVTETPWHSD
jgi:hypothetical protein